MIIFIENSKGEFLIQKTSSSRNSIFATTGGYVSYGSTFEDAIVNEVKEELGIDITREDFVEINTYVRDYYIQKVYYLKKDIDINDITIQEDEVEYVKWLDKKTINELIENKEFREGNIEGYQYIIQGDYIMKLDRDYIIKYIKEYSLSKDYVYAMWLEGADGLNQVDEYSDLDIWFDVEDSKREAFIEELVGKLSELGKIDSRMNKVTSEIYQSNIHLGNTSKFLTIDLAAQNDSRERENTCFVKGSITELPKIIFERKNIISFREPESIDKDLLKMVYEEKKNRILQYSRVTKYIKRNQYLECFMEYDKQILKSIVTIARIIYTPEIYDYELCHITRHLPKDIIEKIEKLYKVSSFEDIEKNIALSLEMLDSFDKEIKQKN